MNIQNSRRDQFEYFAYGSNMLRQWLVNRCPSSKAAGPAFIEGYQLTFSKPSVDGSGKATLEARQGGLVHGMLYTIALEERESLDRAEGGYDRRDDVAVLTADGRRISVTTYFAQKRDPALMPYDWYVGLIQAGAMQHDLPEAYRSKLDRVGSLADLGRTKSARQTAIQALMDAGFSDIAGRCR